MDTGLKGKVVLITGATRNHGRASALAFAEEGANLLLCTRQSMELLDETAHLASRTGVRVVTGLCDVADEGQVNSFVRMGLTEFGRIDVLVNNAVWRVRGDILDITTEAWDAAMAVNVHAPFLVCQAVLPDMVERRWGRIINYSGIAPYRGASGQGTLKMACEGLTRAIAREYGTYNITANCIGPGSIDVLRTPGQESGPDEGREALDIPVPRRGTVEECSALVVFLASEQASYITGQSYLVNGGAHFR
jgi:3-oxoacyl-[acyl-carrier protein] reductase